MLLRIIFWSVIFGSSFALLKKHPGKVESRIIGGDEVLIEDHFYQVSLLFRGSHVCGGTLVGPTLQYVVTSAQCTKGLSVSTLSVRAGSTIRNSGGSIKYVRTIHQHTSYNDWTFDYDIAILKLASAFDGDNDAIMDAILPAANLVVPVGRDLIATGWGATSEGGAMSDKLNAVTLQSVSDNDCIAVYGQGMITARMRCAGAPGKDTCQGDVGGPLVMNENLLIGITSWGFGCARPGYPSVYTDVVALRNYILSNTA